MTRSRVRVAGDSGYRDRGGAADRAHDLRLVPAAGVAWAVTAWAFTGAMWALVFVLVGVGWAAVFVLRSPGDPARFRALAAVCAALVGYGLAACHRVQQEDAHPVRGHESSVVVAHVRLESDPRPVRGGKVLIRGELEAFAPAVSGPGDAGGVAACRRAEVLVFADPVAWAVAGDGAVRGAVVEVLGTVARPRAPGSGVAVLAVRAPPRIVHGAGAVARMASGARRGLAQAASARLAPEEAGLLPALVVGDVSGQSAEFTARFRTSGLAHLAAVSGGNVAIVLGGVVLLVRRVGGGPRLAAVVAAVALGAFVVVVGPEPSVLRAAVMGAVGLLAVVVARRSQVFPALAAGVLGLVGYAPALAVDVGFALSVLVTCGLVLAAPPVSCLLRARGWPGWAARATGLAVAAQLVGAPVIAAAGGGLAVYGVIANLLVAPVVPALTVLGVIALVLAQTLPPLATVVVEATTPGLWWMCRVAAVVAELPGAVVSAPSGQVGALILVVLESLTVALVLLVVRFRRIGVARWWS